MPAPTRRTLRFGISRGHGGALLFTGLRQFSESLTQVWGRPVEHVVCFDYHELYRSLLDGRVEAAWLPPLLIAHALERNLTLAAVAERRGALWYRSALLVHAESPAHQLSDLKRVRAAWVDPNSASGYIFPRLHLVEAGLDLATLFAEESFHGSAAGACAAVAAKQADLCACFVSENGAQSEAALMDEVRGASGGVGANLRLLALTEPIPPDGIVLSDHLASVDRARLTEALLELHHDATGNIAVRSLLQADRLCPATPEIVQLFARLKAHAPEQASQAQ